MAGSGQFENLIRAERRLWLVVPLALLLTLSLLYLSFNSLRDALMIFSGVLFARVIASSGVNKPVPVSASAANPVSPCFSWAKT